MNRKNDTLPTPDRRAGLDIDDHQRPSGPAPAPGLLTMPNAQTRRLWWRWGRITVVVAFLGVAALNVDGAENSPFRSKWDEGLLKAELHDVQLKETNIRAAWQHMAVKYLLRCNLYLDPSSDSHPKGFAFQKETSTGKELLEAFLAAYPAYTLTQDPRTAVIWLHPQTIAYGDILSQKIRIVRVAAQVPMYGGIHLPLLKLLGQSEAFLHQFGGAKITFGYAVDLPSGVYSVRDILNICCIWEPTKAFGVVSRDEYHLGLQPVNLHSLFFMSGSIPPREGLVRLWRLEIGEPKSGMPSLEEIVSGLSDSDPRKRWAARIYLGDTPENNSILEVAAKCDTPKKAVWTALAIKYMWRRGTKGEPLLSIHRDFDPLMGALTNSLGSPDRSVALLAAMELAREKNDPAVMDVVAGHKFTQVEIDSIKPDLYRIARESKLVRDKFIAMKFEAPELSADALNDLGRTDLFELVAEDKK